jgi:hypothetical protein
MSVLCKTCGHSEGYHEVGDSGHRVRYGPCHIPGGCPSNCQMFAGGKDDSTNELMAACRQTAVQCLAPFRADDQALLNATALIYDLVIAQMTEPTRRV